jgi:predicted RNase H-like HicB family nuclease
MYSVETEQEEDGRWIAEVPELPGVLAYGQSRGEAVTKAQALCLHVLAERLEHGERLPQIENMFSITGRSNALAADSRHTESRVEYRIVAIDRTLALRVFRGLMFVSGIATTAIACATFLDEHNMPTFSGGPHGARELELVIVTGAAGLLQICLGLLLFRGTRRIIA